MLDVIKSNRYTTEAHLMVGTNAVLEAYNQRIVSEIALTDRAYNIADQLTKTMHRPLLRK